MADYILAMATTIQVSSELLNALKKRKLYRKETYDEVIWDLLEDTMELSDETKQAIKEAEEDFRKGRVISHEEVKKRLRL